MPPKHPKAFSKGLFGLPKDPKNMVLFTFTGGEAWPSDEDSSDSDYLPPGDTAQNGAGKTGGKDNRQGKKLSSKGAVGEDSDDEDYVPPGMSQKGKSESMKRGKVARGRRDTKGKHDCHTSNPTAKPSTRPKRNVKRIRVFADSDSDDSSKSSSSGSSDEELSDHADDKEGDDQKRGTEDVKNKRILRPKSTGSLILNIVESEHDYISSPEREERPQEVEYSSELEEEERAVLKHDHDYTDLSAAGTSTDIQGIPSEQPSTDETMNSAQGTATHDGCNENKHKSMLRSTPQTSSLSTIESGKQKKTPKKRVRFEDVPEDRKGERRKKRVKSKKDCESCEVSQWGQLLPVEIIVRILQFAVADQGAVPLLCRAAKVCHFWHEASKHPSLWRHMDLSSRHIMPNARSDRTLLWLSENRFSQLRSLNLSHWVFLTKQGIQAVAERCPHLEAVDLTKCIKIGPEGVTALVDRCSKLCNIQLASAQSEMVRPACLKHVLEKTGPRLEELNLSSNKLRGAPGIFKSIANCPQLLVLDMCNCTFTTGVQLFPIEALQTGCPRLRVLRLAGSNMAAGNTTRAVQERSPGFPELLEVSLAIDCNSAGSWAQASNTIDDNFLHRLLKTSSKLKLLDLRGCTSISRRGLGGLPVSCLQHFFISNTNSSSNHEGVVVIIQRCQHTLVEMDLSWNVYPVESLDRALHNLSSSKERSKLKTLNLSGTCVTTDMVRSVLAGCPHLTQLNLTSCRALPRGMKQLFEGEAITELRKNSADLLASTSDL